MRWSRRAVDLEFDDLGYRYRLKHAGDPRPRQGLTSAPALAALQAAVERGWLTLVQIHELVLGHGFGPALGTSRTSQ